MKKHIFGITIFSLIVFVTIFVYGILNFSKIRTVYDVGVRKIASTETIEIKQAVFDARTKEFRFSLYVPNESGKIDLHFFKKDEQGRYYLKTEQVAYASASFGAFTFSKSYDWLENNKSSENLYVIAQSALELEDHRAQPKFDVMKAIPVTIDYGR